MPRKTRPQTPAKVFQLKSRDQVLEDFDRELTDAQADIDRLQEISDDALGASQYTAATNATSRLSAIRMVHQRIESARDAEAAPTVLHRVRFYRAQAAREGSWTAVSSLLAQEREIEREEAARQAAEEERARLAANPDHVLTTLEGALRQLPDGLAHELRERLKWT